MGVLFHEFVTGKPPFGDRRKATYQEVYKEIRYYTYRRKQMELDSDGLNGAESQSEANRRVINCLLPYFYMEKAGDDAVDLVLRLLSPVASMRLRGTMFKSHDYFSDCDFSWEKLRSRECAPPYVPPLESPYDTRHFDDFESTDIAKNFFTE